VFALNDDAGIERLFRDAGFRDVELRRYEKEMHLPPPRDLLWQYLLSTPLAAAVAEASDAVRSALERDVVKGWEPWITDDGLTYRQGMIVTTARR
jgi:hypothetical protein